MTEESEISEEEPEEPSSAVPDEETYKMVNGKPVKIIGSRSVEELRQLVSEIVAGTFITDAQVSADLVQSVFMPLMFGAFNVPEGVEENLMGEKAPNSEPYKAQKPPEPLPYPAEPPALPAEVVLLEPDENLALACKFGDISDESYQEHLDYIKSQNQALKLKYKTELDATSGLRKAWKKDCLSIDRKNQRGLNKYLKNEIVLMDAHLQKEEEVTAWRDRRREMFSEWWSELGAIGEHISKAGPRSINGYPIFFSMAVINKEDWDRIRAAVKREFDHRDNMEV